VDPISIRNGRSRRFLPVAPTTAFPPFSPGRDSGPAIRAACAQFVVLCRQFNFCTRTIVAIDGSKFKAVSNRDKNFTVAKVAKRIEQVEASIGRYLAVLDRADREDGDTAEAKTIRLKKKIGGLRRQMQSLREIGKLG
jgi:hypothetical protein